MLIVLGLENLLVYIIWFNHTLKERLFDTSKYIAVAYIDFHKGGGPYLVKIFGEGWGCLGCHLVRPEFCLP